MRLFGSKEVPVSTAEIEAILESHDGGPEWERRTKSSFESRRGDQVHFRRWDPRAGTKAAALLFIAHGLHSHGGRWADVAHWCTDKGYVVFANDHIGHGLTAAANPASMGMVDDYTKMTDDFTNFVHDMIEQEEDKTLPVYVLGHSMGSLIATVAVKQCQDDPTVGPRMKKLVLSGCPLLPGPSSASPFGLRFLFPLTKNEAMLKRLGGILARIDPSGPAAPIDSDALSTDEEVAQQVKIDPLMVKGSIRNKTAFEVIKLVEAAKDAAPHIKMPTRLIHGGDDDIAYPAGSFEMMDLLTACSSKTVQVCEGAKHEVLRHKDKFEDLLTELRSFWEK